MVFLADADRHPDVPEALLLVLSRAREGERWRAEVKAFAARDGSLRAALYGTEPGAPGWAAADWTRLLAWWAERSGEARAAARADGESLSLRLRGRTWSLTLEAEALRRAEPRSDPEGTHVYAAGRATVRWGERTAGGWVVTEATDPALPAEAWVDYGDFTFAVLRRGGEVALLKRSRGRGAFDDLVVWQKDGPPTRPPRSAGWLAQAGRASEDHVAGGKAPDGRRLRYGLGLASGDARGVVARLRPAP